MDESNRDMQTSTLQDDKLAHEEGELRRTTEQGDELDEQHSLAQKEHRAKTPYAPPRQPAQDPPSR